MSYCKYCGNTLEGKEEYCPYCGAYTKNVIDVNEANKTVNQNINTTIKEKGNKNYSAAFVFMIISICAYGLFSFLNLVSLMLYYNARDFLSLCYYLVLFIVSISMTAEFNKKRKNKEKISTGFKVCVLLFCNLIAGILLLASNENN